MEALVLDLVRPIVAHPDAVSITTHEGEALVTLQLSVHDDDRDIVADDSNLRAIRNVLSAAAGARKATVELASDDDAADSDDAGEE